MNSKAFNHLIEKFSEPSEAKRKTAQEKYNDTRFNDFIEAKLTRPQFLMIRHDLPASAKSLPVSESTDELGYDVVIHGGISDGTNRKINLRERQEGIVRTDSGDDYLSLDGLFGKTVETAGQTGAIGVQDFAYPMSLREKRTLSLDVYKPDADAETMHTVLCASRVFTPNDREAQISEAERDAIWAEIFKDVSPKHRNAVCPVIFKPDGKARAETPKFDCPMLILGFRVTFTNAKVNLGFTSADSFSTAPFPIWALASEPGNGKQLYQRLKRALYVGTGEQLLFQLENTIDGVDTADNGQIEVLLRKP